MIVTMITIETAAAIRSGTRTTTASTTKAATTAALATLTIHAVLLPLVLSSLLCNYLSKTSTRLGLPHVWL